MDVILVKRHTYNIDVLMFAKESGCKTTRHSGRIGQGGPVPGEGSHICADCLAGNRLQAACFKWCHQNLLSARRSYQPIVGI